jgi:phage protein D
MSRPFATVAFQTDRKVPQKQPREVLIRQREWKHDTAIITMELESKAQNKYSHGAPVTIAWGWRPDDVEYFHGYVHHVVQKQSQHKLISLQVYCVSASYRMKQVRLRSFVNKLAHQVATQIAKEHRFSLTAMRHTFTHEQLTQHGRSDWDFLVWLSKRVGFTFYANKTDLVFTRRAIDTKASRNRPTFTLTTGTYRQRGAIYKVDHKVGEAVPGTENRARVLGGVTNAGATLQRIVHSATASGAGTHKISKPVFGRVTMRRPALTALAAQSQLEAEMDLHRFNTIAEAELSGNTRVHQGSTVRFSGTDEDSDGYWYVTGVDHHITLSDYRLKAQVARDQLGDLGDTVQVSDSGNPVLLTDCDVSVDSRVSTAPEPIYDPLEDCVPIEQAVQLDDVTLPFVLDPIIARRVDKHRRSVTRTATKKPTKKPAAAHSTKTVLRGHSKVAGKQTPASAPKPKLTGWRASSHTVRITR